MVTTIIDGLAGSCGKGKVIGYYSQKEDIDLAISNCMPNAGHTYEKNGRKRVFRNIPVSSVNLRTDLFIGAGSVIDMDVLKNEYEDNIDILKDRNIFVHPMVPIINERHIEEEKSKLRSGSTFKGGGACLAEKIMRDPNLEFFKEYKSIRSISNEEYHNRLIEYLKNSKKILIEGSQGCDLDINHSGHYPHVTSRQISVAQMFADSGISSKYLEKVIMVIRPFPIRISNTNELGININTGNYGHSKELSWKEINISSSMGSYPYFPDGLEDYECYNSNNFDLTELTTVTKKVRRVFELDIEQLKRNVEINTPDEICLNFFQQFNIDYSNLSDDYETLYVDRYLREYLNYLEDTLDTPITMLGTGADNKSMILRKKL